LATAEIVQTLHKAVPTQLKETTLENAIGKG